MFSAAQVIAIALSSFKIIGTSDWLQVSEERRTKQRLE